MTKTVQEAVIEGYAITSRAYKHASRIDREDWRQYMAKKHAPWDPEGEGRAWVECLGDRSAADHYRRCYSKDQIVVPDDWVKILRNSGEGPQEFRHHLYKNSGKAEQQNILAKLLAIEHSPNVLV
jgi:hypothetical protein